MKLLRMLWIKHLRYWHTIDLDAALQSGNWEWVTDCRIRIAHCDAELDRVAI